MDGKIFPQNIWCVGRNYRDHAKELNNPIPTTPLIFLKAGSCAIHSQEILLPKWSQDIHHECEIAIRLSATGSPTHLGLALDLTARDAQNEAKKKGEPWTKAKSFIGACPLSEFIPWSDVKNFSDLEFEFTVNGKIAQHGFAKDMIFNPEVLIATLKSTYPISEGDLLLTGTPAGVGPLKSGDQLSAQLKGFITATWSVCDYFDNKLC